jgi:hypothetical protein
MAGVENENDWRIGAFGGGAEGAADGGCGRMTRKTTRGK